MPKTGEEKTIAIAIRSVDPNAFRIYATLPKNQTFPDLHKRWVHYTLTNFKHLQIPTSIRHFSCFSFDPLNPTYKTSLYGSFS